MLHSLIYETTNFSFLLPIAIALLAFGAWLLYNRYQYWKEEQLEDEDDLTRYLWEGNTLNENDVDI